MDIEIKFENPGRLSPKIIVRNGDYLSLFTHTRWIQLIALLAFKKIQELDGGKVSIDELKHSLAFRRLSYQNVSRFFYNTTNSQSPLISEFIHTCLVLPALGPFRLGIGSQSIKTDPGLLQNYIYLIFGHFNPKDCHSDYLWQASLNALRAFELQSACFALSNCLLDNSEPDNYPLSMKSLALINLATVEYLMRGNSLTLNSLLKRTGAMIGSLKDGKERTLLQAYLLGSRVWMTPVEIHNARRTIQANNEAIDIASLLPEKSPDRLCA